MVKYFIFPRYFQLWLMNKLAHLTEIHRQNRCCQIYSFTEGVPDEKLHPSLIKSLIKIQACSVSKSVIW